jgi:leucyl-tRNA synthetase
MQYNFSEIEKKWQALWNEKNIYKVENDFSKPKCYVLDMFPYPSGAGLHVGHPLGYIASDIYARYKRLKGFNVLHPMGFDSFGLPAEQYAIETGQHPATTTKININRYKEQLGKIGFSFDWSREVQTANPSYYKWTQWIFLQLFNSWYNPITNKAEKIETIFNKGCPMSDVKNRTDFENRKSDIENRLMEHRLAFKKESYVNWCEVLGTVLANDEVVNGVSERGGHPVERRLMSQWFLRITAFADRLLEQLDTLDYPESLKEMQRNWIGKSEGAEIFFDVRRPTTDITKTASKKLNNEYQTTTITVFTTRPDTIFGVSFMVLAPEHELVNTITTPDQKQAIEAYQKYVSSRSERERMSETKVISGCNTGSFAIHPFTGKEIPVWISEYVLAGYGTGAIMAVPCGDERDYAFAKHFDIDVPNIFKDVDISEKACINKNVTIINSDFISDLSIKAASKKAIDTLEEKQLGVRKINYRMRDAGFSRQRYWGEPFPIIYDEKGNAIALTDKDLPLQLPFLETYSAGPNGKGPLANATDWVNNVEGKIRETDTMPGYAGSSWYYLRYMDPHNTETFCDKKISDYWNQVDVYVGGAEHAVGHLLYSRMWCKTLFDLGFISYNEPYKKLINQGMIQGISEKGIVQTSKNTGGKLIIDYIPSDWNNKTITLEDNEFGTRQVFYSHDLLSAIEDKLRIEFSKDYNFPINSIEDNKANIQELIKQRPDLMEAIYVCRGGFWLHGQWHNQGDSLQNVFFTSSVSEKMSKSKYNIVNPNDIIAQYGADTFRMYEMFLGPLEISKPWDTKGIEGVHRFLKKLWRLYVDENTGCIINNEKASLEEFKILHQTIKKIECDIEHFALNTSISQFMICVNEMVKLNCNKREILEPLLILLAPFAPHISEELWELLGNKISILNSSFPILNEIYLVENSFVYPVAIQGKARAEMEFALDASQDEIQTRVLENEIVQKWMEAKPMKKFIFVKGKMINVVV